MMSTEAFAMTSAVRRPSLNRRLAEEAPMCCISVSATMSCFTPWKARNCTGTACKNQTVVKQCACLLVDMCLLLNWTPR